ncbi:MAG: hypothetical protein AB7K52_13925 [Phycisphaerales bacterium]
MPSFSRSHGVRCRRAHLKPALAGVLLSAALSLQAHAGTAPASYLLTAVARTGGPDRSFGVPPDSTITGSRPGINRAGSVVLRFHDTASRADGLMRFDPRSGRSTVIHVAPRPDPFGLQPVLSPLVAVSGDVLAVPRVDDPGRIELRSLSGDLLISRRLAHSGTGPISRVELSGPHLAISSGDPGSALLAATTLSAGDVVVQRLVAAGPDTGIFSLGPAALLSSGEMVSHATINAGDALVQWDDAGVVSRLIVALDQPGLFAFGPYIDANDRGDIVAPALLFGGQWQLQRFDADGAHETLATEGVMNPAQTVITPGTLALWTPSLNEHGHVAFIATDESGPAVYSSRAPGDLQRVLGFGDQVIVGEDRVLIGLGHGPERQVTLSDAVLNDDGHIAVVVRLRDGTSALVIARPVDPFDCPADFNADRVVNADDLGDFINAFFSGDADVRVDFNRDGSVDADDLGDFINAFFAADCGI